MNFKSHILILLSFGLFAFQNAFAANQSCSVRADALDFQVRVLLQDRFVMGRYSPHGVPEIVATYMEHSARAKTAQDYVTLVRYVLNQPASQRVLVDMRSDVQWMQKNLDSKSDIKWIGTEIAPIPGQNFEQLIYANLSAVDKKMIRVGFSEAERGDMLMTLFGSGAYFFYSRNLAAKGIKLIPLEDTEVSAKSDRINIEIYSDLAKLKSEASNAMIDDIDRANMKLNQYLTSNSGRLEAINKAEIEGYLASNKVPVKIVPSMASLGMKYRLLVAETKQRDRKVVENVLSTTKNLGSGLFIFGLYHFQEQANLLKKSACNR